MPRIALWTFDEFPGSETAFDTETSDDVAQNGTFVNGATTTGTGSGVFDGVNDYVEVPTDPGFDLDTGSIVITFTQDTASAGDLPFGTAAAQTLFSRDATDFGGGGHLSIYVRSDGSIGVRHQTIDQSFTYQGGSVTLGKPTTLTYTWGPTGSQLIVNGEVVDRGAQALTLSGDRQPITIGASQAVSSSSVADDPVGFFDGSIDSVEIYDEIIRQSTIPCFTAGTLILTAEGECPVEDLSVGDLIRTKDHGLQPIRWIGSRNVDLSVSGSTANLHPVRICAGAMGKGLPKRDLLVSRQHRMLVSSKIAARMFCSPSVLIPAIKLIDCPEIEIDLNVQTVEYFHLLFDQHEVIFAEGTPTESLYIGNEAMKAMSTEARLEVQTLFPELENETQQALPTHPVPSGRLQKRLIARHAKNAKPLLQTWLVSV